MDSLTGVASGDVRFTPNSGRKWLWRWMSGYDPKRTFSGLCESAGGYRKQVVSVNLITDP